MGCGESSESQNSNPQNELIKDIMRDFGQPIMPVVQAGIGYGLSNIPGFNENSYGSQVIQGSFEPIRNIANQNNENTPFGINSFY